MALEVVKLPEAKRGVSARFDRENQLLFVRGNDGKESSFRTFDY